MILARTEAEAGPEAEIAPERALLCAACRRRVTSEDARIERAGAHVHVRMNPGGWVHELGCFATAPGARVQGEATTEHTWFPGFAWRLAACAGCRTHLGWRFDAEEGGAGFFGLILSALARG